MLTYNLHHVNGLYFQITSDGGKNRDYEVTIIDRKSKETLYKTIIGVNGWIRLERKYLSDLAIIIRFEGRTIEQINFLR
jgi:hypothetical protein